MSVIKFPTQLRLIVDSKQELSPEIGLKIFDLIKIRGDLKAMANEIKLTKTRLTMRIVSNEDVSATKSSTDK